MSDDESVANPPIKLVNKPNDTAINQQRMKSWNPILDPVWVICTYIILGIIFIPVGLKINSIADGVSELSQKYDSHDDTTLDCHIGDNTNTNKTCTVSFVTKDDMEPPILVYYEIKNFYQNHRKYITSRDDKQLFGYVGDRTKQSKDLCSPLDQLGNISISPCGLIANTLFNDVIKLVGGKDNKGQDLILVEKGIAWQSDIDYKFKQPDTFRRESCDCADCPCDPPKWSCTNSTPFKDDYGKCWKYFYPNKAHTQYLYETYPMVVNPIEGVMNEHFIVWMNAAAVTPFRKLYGYIEEPVAKGETLAFQIQANWEVKSFKGSKTLIVSTTEIFGGKNKALGQVFIVCGGFLLSLGFLFGVKHFVWPRKVGSKKYLRFKEE
uniref:Cell cycle control protein 50A n=1 Tax=Eucampia antarctica TaxID=49252 RepID=A0A7S2WPH8_9STRA|mmetsp:Transcript_7553/g.7124  ORF Transcript_7553/g.7124 Transcript_7553/m.7124 type:complete len:379 (+) Transcript_7553:139-1275(+)